MNSRVSVPILPRARRSRRETSIGKPMPCPYCLHTLSDTYKVLPAADAVSVRDRWGTYATATRRSTRTSLRRQALWSIFLGVLFALGFPLCSSALGAASKSYYSVLGVDRGVSQEELKRAYRREAVKWHPDKNTANVEQAERKFKEIQEAYDTLRDPRTRGDYDDSLRHPRTPSQSYGSYTRRSSDSEDAGDLFSTGFYGRMKDPAGGTSGRYPPPGAAAAAEGWGGSMGHAPQFEGIRINLFDIFKFGPGNKDNLGVPKARWRHLHVKLVVTLAELLTGVEKEVDIRDSLVERYRQAARTGLLSEVMQEGAAVFGALLLRCPLPISAVAFAAYVHLKLPRVPKGTFKVPILPGYRRGTKITFSTPEEVDVTFEVVEKPSEFRRSGDDLFVLVRLSPQKAKNGCRVKIPTLDKGKITLRLNRGEASDGYTRKLSGLGMPRRTGDKDGGRGDLVVHFLVEDDL